MQPAHRFSRHCDPSARTRVSQLVRASNAQESCGRGRGQRPRRLRRSFGARRAGYAPVIDQRGSEMSVDDSESSPRCPNRPSWTSRCGLAYPTDFLPENQPIRRVDLSAVRPPLVTRPVCATRAGPLSSLTDFVQFRKEEECYVRPGGAAQGGSQRMARGGVSSRPDARAHPGGHRRKI